MSRAHRSLWILITLTVLATGFLAQALAAPAGTGADIQVTTSLVLLIVSAALLIRVLRHLTPTTAVRRVRTAPAARRRRRGGRHE